MLPSRLGRLLLVLLLLANLAPRLVAAQGTPEDEIAQRRLELAALERAVGQLRELLAAASRGDLLLRDDRVGLLHPVSRARLAEEAATAAALPASVRQLARPALPPGTTPEALVAALAAETRALVDRELVPQIGALDRARSDTLERIAWLEREIQRRAEEARIAAEQARKASEERARIEAERQRVEAERARLEAERQRVEAEQRRLAERQARIEAELARTRVPAPAPPPQATPVPAATPVAAPVRRAFERVEVLHEVRNLRIEPPSGPSQQISIGRTPDGFVLFDLWLDRDRRIASFVCSWTVRGLDDPIPPGREVTVELVGRCASEAGPPLPVALPLRLEVEGLELVGDRRRGPTELWIGTRDGEVRLETVGAFLLRAPKSGKPGDELRLRIVLPGCCTPLTMVWRYPG